MRVVAVINRKGGSGKSTLATHLAGYCARQGLKVMLGDVDRQQSSLAWLKRRAEQPVAQGAPVVGWAVDPRSVLRPPAGISHVVIDTPGGLRDSELARVVMYADMIVMPVCHSLFDRESAAACYDELHTLPRVASGRCKVGIVGMRLDARTKPAPRMHAWATENGLPYVGSVRESQLYPRGAEQGLTVFDAEPAKVQTDLAQWKPVMDWVEAAWATAEKMEATSKAAVPVSAPSIAPQAASRRRTLVRAPLPVPTAPASEFRASREIVRPTPRAQRFGWLFTVLRAWA